MNCIKKRNFTIMDPTSALWQFWNGIHSLLSLCKCEFIGPEIYRKICNDVYFQLSYWPVPGWERVAQSPLLCLRHCWLARPAVPWGSNAPSFPSGRKWICAWSVHSVVLNLHVVCRSKHREPCTNSYVMHSWVGRLWMQLAWDWHLSHWWLPIATASSPSTILCSGKKMFPFYMTNPAYP